HLPTITRIKNFESFSEKILRKQYFQNPFEDIKDILGLRIITYYESDLEKVIDIITNQFEILKGPIDKGELLKPSEFGYRSIHLIVSMNEKRKELPECREYKDLCAEIQIRTVIEHAWAEIQHHLDYKPDISKLELSDNLKRRLDSLMALFEIANREFDYIRNENYSSFKKIVEEKEIKNYSKKYIQEIINNNELFLTNANFFYEQNQFQNLLDFANDALEVNPRFTKALIVKGNTLYKLEQHEEALKCYEKALEIDPNDKEIWINKGNALSDLERHEEALKCYDNALEIDPNDLKAWNNKGVVLSDLEQYEEALKCYDKVLEIDPNDSNAWYNKGVVLSDLEQHDEALKCYDKALEIDPNDKEAWGNKGNALSDLEQHEEALKFYDKVLEIDPNDLKAWYNKGTALNALEQHEEALKCYDKALEIDPNDLKAWVNKGNALNALEQHEEALKCYDKVLEIDPNDKKVLGLKKVITLKKLDQEKK
ncbi:MAG: tetratricopeptide repeat protein, partial [Promethearchaeota archaeon]